MVLVLKWVRFSQENRPKAMAIRFTIYDFLFAIAIGYCAILWFLLPSMAVKIGKIYANFRPKAMVAQN
jgi:hypothetical protein